MEKMEERTRLLDPSQWDPNGNASQRTQYLIIKMETKRRTKVDH